MPNAQYQLPQQPPPSQSTGQLLNTQPAPQMAADKNVASLSMPTNQAVSHLGFANTMLQHLIEYKGGKNKPAQATQEQQENPQEEATETPAQESKEQPDTSGVDQKIADLEANHEKEIMMLKHELEVQGIKEGNDKKVNDLEKKHQQEIEDLKSAVKSIISA